MYSLLMANARRIYKSSAEIFLYWAPAVYCRRPPIINCLSIDTQEKKEEEEKKSLFDISDAEI